MKQITKKIVLKVVVGKEDFGFSAFCDKLRIVSLGVTQNEAITKIKEAVDEHFMQDGALVIPFELMQEFNITEQDFEHGEIPVEFQVVYEI